MSAKSTPRRNRSASYEEELLASLKNPDEALAYLRVSFQDDDPRVFLTALRRVAQANGGFTELAARTGNPKLGNIVAVLRSFGMKLTVERVGLHCCGLSTRRFTTYFCCSHFVTWCCLLSFTSRIW